MRLFAFLLVIGLIVPVFASAALVYNDPEVFSVRQNTAFFTDPTNGQAVRVQRLSNEQIRTYLQNDAIRAQVGLPLLEKKSATQNMGLIPVELRTRRPDGDYNLVVEKPLTGPGPTVLRKKESVYIQPGLVFKPRVQPSYDETLWIYKNTQRLHDRVMHRNYRSDYYGDENLMDMINNNRVRYQPWGMPKYYD